MLVILIKYLYLFFVRQKFLKSLPWAEGKAAARDNRGCEALGQPLKPGQILGPCCCPGTLGSSQCLFHLLLSLTSPGPQSCHPLCSAPPLPLLFTPLGGCTPLGQLCLRTHSYGWSEGHWSHLYPCILQHGISGLNLLPPPMTPLEPPLAPGLHLNSISLPWHSDIVTAPCSCPGPIPCSKIE